MSLSWAFWKQRARACWMAQGEVEARRVWFCCLDGHRCVLDLMAATWARAARALRATILVTDITRRGGVRVAFVWTSWDSLGVAEDVAVKHGGRGGVRPICH